MLGATAEMFEFTAADDAVISLYLDPGQEVAVGSIFLFDANGTLLVAFNGHALDGDMEVSTTPAKLTMVERSGGPGRITLLPGSLCAESCKVIISGAGAVERIAYSFEGTDFSVLPLASGLRTFLSDGYRPPSGFAAAVRAEGFYADAQVSAAEVLRIEGSPVFVGGVPTDARSYRIGTGNMTILAPDGEVISCAYSCMLGDLTGDRSGDYQVHWNRTEAGELDRFLYVGVDVVLPS